MIGFLLLFFLFSIALSLLYLNLVYAAVQAGILFSVFVIVAMFERIWETFLTPKDKNALKFRGDWTLLATTTSYFIVSLIFIFAFFLVPEKNYFLSGFGVLVFIGSIMFRWWAIKTLKNEWTIHLNDSKKEKAILTRTGPYKYIRHPIYLGAILDLIGLALISNFFIGLIIVALINVPLFVWRSLYEERMNAIKFGQEYFQYKRETPLMIPWQLKKYKK